MRTLFVNPPYGRYDMGRFGFPQPHPVLSRRLGQFEFLTDLLRQANLNVSDFDRVADKGVRDELKAEYERCQAEDDSTKQLTCYAALAARVYNVLKDQGARPAAAPAPVTPRPANGFPIVPVAIGAVAAAGLIYFLATR